METAWITIIVGHSGSGKTEFVSNYAPYLKRRYGMPVTVADLDVVNPYFRARGLKDYFLEKGIRVISSNREEASFLDAPALSAALQSCFQGNGNMSVVDAGGGPEGSLILARYAPFLKNKKYNMWMVVNANRPKTTEKEDVIRCVREIENASRLKMNGLISNTHLLGETSRDDLLRGERLVKAVEEETGLPVIYTAIEKTQAETIDKNAFSGTVLPLSVQLTPEWL